MDIAVHASFLPHDDPSPAGQARSPNGRWEYEANAQEEAMPK
jgi:hypothetical protein